MKKLVALVALVFALAACGGGGGRPSTDDIAKALKDKGNPNGAAIASAASDKAIDCIAKVLHDSKLSDSALKALVDGKANYSGDKDDAQAISDVTGDIGKCVTG